MAETTKELAAERDDLKRQVETQTAEIERLRGEVAAARAGAKSPATVTLSDGPRFRGGAQISEGERQDLAVAGAITSAVTGKVLLASDFGIEVLTQEGRDRLDRTKRKLEESHGGVYGVDYVYPSVAPGVLAQDAQVRGAQPATAVRPISDNPQA